MTRPLRFVVLALSLFASPCIVPLVGVRAEPRPSAAGAPATPVSGALPTPPPPNPGALPNTAMPPVAAKLLSPLDGVPANGSLLFDTAAIPPDSVSFSSPAHRPDATVRLIDGYAVATPTEVLQTGVGYQVNASASGTISLAPLTLTFGPAWQPSLPDVQSSLSIERIDGMAMQKCCTGVPGFPARTPSCFFAERTHLVRVKAALTTTAAPPQLTQYLFRLKAAGPTGGFPGFRPFDRADDVPVEWRVEQAEYCVELEAIEITSGRSERHPALAPSCIAHGQLGRLAPEVIPLDPKLLASAVCAVPPLGHERDWCEINRSACEAIPAAVGCENFDHLCRAGPVPMPAPLPPLATAPNPRVPGPKPLAGQLAAGSGGSAAPSRPRPMRPGAGFGCTAIAGDGLADLGSLAIALLAVARLRRRPRST